MTDGLGDALDHINRQIADGLVEAEEELAEVRERCRVLEGEIRSMRAALERMDAQATSSPWITEPVEIPATVAASAVAPATSAAAAVDVMPPTPPFREVLAPAPVALSEAPAVPEVSEVPEVVDVPDVVEVRVDEAEIAIAVPSAEAPPPPVAAPAPSVGREAPTAPDPTEGAPRTGDATASDGERSDDDEGPTEFAEYMPMLEQLWAIARHEDDPADAS